MKHRIIHLLLICLFLYSLLENSLAQGDSSENGTMKETGIFALTTEVELDSTDSPGKGSGKIRLLLNLPAKDPTLDTWQILVEPVTPATKKKLIGKLGKAQIISVAFEIQEPGSYTPVLVLKSKNRQIIVGRANEIRVHHSFWFDYLKSNSGPQSNQLFVAFITGVTTIALSIFGTLYTQSKLAKAEEVRKEKARQIEDERFRNQKKKEMNFELKGIINKLKHNINQHSVGVPRVFEMPDWFSNPRFDDWSRLRNETPYEEIIDDLTKIRHSWIHTDRSKEKDEFIKDIEKVEQKIPLN